MKMAIIGATAGVGLELAKLALADGHDVTVLARTPSKMPVSDPRLRIITGDAGNLESIREVARDQDVVCVCLGTKNVTKRQTMFSRSSEHLAKVLTSSQLLICLTGIGTGDSRGHGPWLYDNFFIPVVLKRQYDDKGRQEEIIKSAIPHWIIVRCGFLTNGPRTGQYRAITELHGRYAGRISRADVADFMLSQAKEPGFVGDAPIVMY